MSLEGLPPPDAEASAVGLAPSRLPPANDRMLTTVFLAALLHAIVILGVTFSAVDTERGGAPGLEVILVNDQAPEAAKNADAKYLAERNQDGSGNTADDLHALIPKSSPAPADRAGLTEGDAPGAAPPAPANAAAEAALATQRTEPRILYLAADEPPPPPAPDPAVAGSGVPLLLEQKSDLGMSANDEGVELRLRGARKNTLWMAADTRESDLAVYIDTWRRKVERVGTINFPDAARRANLSGTPVVEVTIAANGRLARAAIRQSSGHPEIDEAALRILHLAAPFDPLPRALAATHDEIRIAYEWQFLNGALQGSSVHSE